MQIPHRVYLCACALVGAHVRVCGGAVALARARARARVHVRAHARARVNVRMRVRAKVVVVVRARAQRWRTSPKAPPPILRCRSYRSARPGA